MVDGLAWCLNDSSAESVRIFGFYSFLVYMDPLRGSSKDLERGGHAIREWEGLRVLDRETLSGSTAGHGALLPCCWPLGTETGSSML